MPNQLDESRTERTTTQCSTKQSYNKDGNKVTTVTCPTGEANYTEGERPRLNLSNTDGTSGVEVEGNTSAYINNSYTLMKVEDKKLTTLVTDKNLPNNTSVYCDVNPLTYYTPVLSKLLGDDVWADGVRATKNVAGQLVAYEIQDYAKQHPDVIAELNKISPVITGGSRVGDTPVGEDQKITLQEILATPAPQFRACPAESRKEGIVVERLAR